jgi:hypothetical protein
MSTEPSPSSGTANAVFVEDLFLTDAFMIKGRLANKCHRLSKMLEDVERRFVTIEDAMLVALRGNEVVRTPRVLVNTDEIVLAHELVDIAGDQQQRILAANEKSIKIRAFYSGSVQIEVAGNVEAGAYEPSRGPGRRYFIMQNPKIRGLRYEQCPELALLQKLSYAIVQKHKLAYIYDFS